MTNFQKMRQWLICSYFRLNLGNLEKTSMMEGISKNVTDINKPLMSTAFLKKICGRFHFELNAVYFIKVSNPRYRLFKFASKIVG